jgi:predicted peptidase
MRNGTNAVAAGDPQTGPNRPRARPATVPEEGTVLALFSDLSYRYTGRGYHDKRIRYRLFVPEKRDPPQKLPLIVWLHGWGESGDENYAHVWQLGSCIFQPPLDRKRFPFFVLAVQCPSDNRDWTTTSPNADDMIDVVAAILDKTVRDYPVDPTRISLSGISSGGDGCWEFAMRSPDRFSAVAPIGSGGGDLARVNRLVGLPVWAFHSEFDSGTPIDGDRATVAAIQAAGGRAYLTEIPTSVHNCTNACFRDYDLIDWLSSQRRGETSNYAPGTITFNRRLTALKTDLSTVVSSWKPWQIVMQLGVPILLVIAFWSAKRQRRRRSLTSSSS